MPYDAGYKLMLACLDSKVREITAGFAVAVVSLLVAVLLFFPVSNLLLLDPYTNCQADANVA